MSSADMALAGIRSAVPPDEVILAMREVGDKMDVSLKETGIGGVAARLSGRRSPKIWKWVKLIFCAAAAAHSFIPKYDSSSIDISIRLL